MMLDILLENALAIFFIVGSGVATFVALNWKRAKFFWIQSNLYVQYGFPRQVKNAWAWFRRLLASGRRNPAIVFLVIAWGFIVFSVGRFSPDLYELYKELAVQILERGKTDDEYRGIAIRYFGIVAGAGAIIGYIIATARSIMLDNQNKINALAQTTESLVQAIAQIGAVNGDKINMEVRLGGLYSLQRIMQYNQENEVPVVKILYAYVRENIKRNKSGQLKHRDTDGHESYKMPEDIQAALDIIIQFNKEKRKQSKDIPRDDQLNLSHTDFSNYFLAELDFSDIILTHANFSNANLYKADFSRTNLERANLSDVRGIFLKLCDADLSHTNFSGANLFGARVIVLGAKMRGLKIGGELIGANFSNASLYPISFDDKNLYFVNLVNTNLKNSSFRGANLSRTYGLKQEQINQAFGDEATILPEGLVHPKSWIEPRDEDK